MLAASHGNNKNKTLFSKNKKLAMIFLVYLFLLFGLLHLCLWV